MIGVSTGTLALLSILLMGWSSLPSENEVSATQVIVHPQFKSDIVLGARVGARKTGVFCVPAGGLYWRDVKPSQVDAEEIAADQLRLAHIEVVNDDYYFQAGKHLIVEGTIVSARISACVAQSGTLRLIGGRRTTKVSGTITIAWKISDKLTHKVEWETTEEEPIDASGVDLRISETVAGAFASGVTKSIDRVHPPLVP